MRLLGETPKEVPARAWVVADSCLAKRCAFASDFAQGFDECLARAIAPADQLVQRRILLGTLRVMTSAKRAARRWRRSIQKGGG
jgi:hypothetical protein